MGLGSKDLYLLSHLVGPVDVFLPLFDAIVCQEDSGCVCAIVCQEDSGCMCVSPRFIITVSAHHSSDIGDAFMSLTEGRGLEKTDHIPKITRWCAIEQFRLILHAHLCCSH